MSSITDSFEMLSREAKPSKEATNRGLNLPFMRLGRMIKNLRPVRVQLKMELNKKVKPCKETSLLFPDVSAAVAAEVVLKELSFPW